MFFLTPKCPVIGLDQLKYWLGSVKIGECRFGSVNIGLDGLNIKSIG